MQLVSGQVLVLSEAGATDWCARAPVPWLVAGKSRVGLGGAHLTDGSMSLLECLKNGKLHLAVKGVTPFQSMQHQAVSLGTASRMNVQGKDSLEHHLVHVGLVDGWLEGAHRFVRVVLT